MKDSITPRDDYLYLSKSPSQPSLNQRPNKAERRAAKGVRGVNLKTPIGMTEPKARWSERILDWQRYPSMKPPPLKIRPRRSSDGKVPRTPVSCGTPPCHAYHSNRFSCNASADPSPDENVFGGVVPLRGRQQSRQRGRFVFPLLPRGFCGRRAILC